MNAAPALALIAFGSYVLGSISGSLLLGRLRGVDIRTLGSGNAGSTNAFRTQGLAFAIAVMTIDVGKAVLATSVASRIGPQLGATALNAAVVAAIAALIGHVWPALHGFRGGKGAATVVGSLLVLWPQGALIGMLAWLPVLILGGWVSLATMCAGVVVFVASVLCVPFVSQPQISIYTGLVAAAMLWTHRSNIARLRAGTEHRFERARLLRKRAGPAP
ncbi:MAG: glycerol-3-phosphate 1-O-acyltransferase PlsY [Lysobacterales bacterium]